MWPSNKDISLFVGVPVIMTHRVFISFILVAPMKNLYQQTRFDFPMPTIKFLCINYSSINKYI